MSIIGKLASSLDRRDEIPNQELAQQIVDKNDTKAVGELIEHLADKNKNIQSDCIKVLYEIGERNPELIKEYDSEFISLLGSSNNRMIWGAMAALDSITSVNPKGIYKELPRILKAADQGSVITKDHGVNILIKLATHKAYTDTALTLLIDQLKTCATNQLPMYAENAIPVISDPYKKIFMNVLTTRLPDIEKESKQKRVEKVIKKLSKEL